MSGYPNHYYDDPRYVATGGSGGYTYAQDIQIEDYGTGSSFHPQSHPGVGGPPWSPEPQYTTFTAGGYGSATASTGSSFVGQVFTDPGTYHTGTSTRGFGADGEDFRGAPTGRRCIFHRIDCGFRHHDHNEWLEHCDSHIPAPIDGVTPRHYRRDYGGMPVAWTCGFGCGFNIPVEYDHQAMWDRKLEHLSVHMDAGDSIVYNNEGPTWLHYYVKLKLCPPDERKAYEHPAPHKPYNNPVMAFKSLKKGIRDRGTVDARGEPVQSQYQDQTIAPPLGGFPAPPPPHNYAPAPNGSYSQVYQDQQPPISQGNYHPYPHPHSQAW